MDLIEWVPEKVRSFYRRLAEHPASSPGAQERRALAALYRHERGIEGASIGRPPPSPQTRPKRPRDDG